MKKYLGLFVVLSLLLTINPNMVRAEDTQEVKDVERTSELKTEREKIKDDLEAKREEAKKQVESMREEAKSKMEALREGLKKEKDEAKAKIKELRITGREKALERFDNAISRISELKDKVNTQITKFEVKGVATTEAKAFVATAETKLNDAKNKITEINTLLATSINEISAENKTKLRTLTQEAQDFIKGAHLSLNDAVKSLKDAVKVKRDADKSVREAESN